MGAIGAEAQRLCVLLAKMAGGYIGTKIIYISEAIRDTPGAEKPTHLYDFS
jgi:hypothetical protein